MQRFRKSIGPILSFAGLLLAGLLLAPAGCSRQESLHQHGRRPHGRPSAFQHAENTLNVPAEVLDNLDRALEDTLY